MSPFRPAYPALAALLVALPAGAQELRPAPGYFVTAVVEVMAAQQIANGCPALSLDVDAVREGTGALMDRLQSDGFDTSREDAGMLPSREAFAVEQQAFMDKHGFVEGEITSSNVCAAGRAEIAEGSAIGSYLVESQG